MQNALSAALLKAQSEVNATAEKVRANLAIIADANNELLFADKATLVHRLPEDVQNAVKVRLAEHAAKVASSPVNMAALIDAEEARIERGESVPVFAISSAPSSAKINICASCGARLP